MIPSQMLKGILEGCILASINQSECYGYEISEKLHQYGFGKIAEGTIYPLLLRLEKKEWVLSTFRESEVGPKRKYYRLSEQGKVELQAFIAHYDEMNKAVTTLLQDTNGGKYE